jgi:hypothetical protein
MAHNVSHVFIYVFELIFSAEREPDSTTIFCGSLRPQIWFINSVSVTERHLFYVSVTRYSEQQ